MSDTPTIYNHTYQSTTGTLGDYSDLEKQFNPAWQPSQEAQEAIIGALWPSALMNQNQLQQAQQIMANQQNQKRIVKVFIADPDPKLSPDKSLLYSGEEKVTDLTDQELFFEIENIKSMLDKHNELRKGVVDKEATNKAGREVFLEPLKIRDLKMTVVNIAVF